MTKKLKIKLSSLSDAELAEAYLQERSSLIFGEIYARYFNLVKNQCFKVVKDQTDAEDIASESFIKAMSKIDQLSNPKFLKSWLIKIGRNKAIDFTRRRKGKRTLPLVPELIIIDETTPKTVEKDFSKQDLNKINIINSLVAQMKPINKQVFELRYYQEYKVDEIAKMLSKTSGGVKMRLLRTREYIKRNLPMEYKTAV